MKQPVIVFCFWSFLIICVHLWLVTWDQMDLLDVVQTYLRWHSFGVVIGRMELNLQQVTQNANFTPKMMINIINTWVWCALLIHRSLGETQATAMIRLPSGSLVWESKAGFSIKQLMKTQRWFRTSKDRDNATTMSLFGPVVYGMPTCKKNSQSFIVGPPWAGVEFLRQLPKLFANRICQRDMRRLDVDAAAVLSFHNLHAEAVEHGGTGLQLCAATAGEAAFHEICGKWRYPRSNLPALCDNT